MRRPENFSLLSKQSTLKVVESMENQNDEIYMNYSLDKVEASCVSDRGGLIVRARRRIGGNRNLLHV